MAYSDLLHGETVHAQDLDFPAVEDEAVAGREGDGAELGFDELVAGAEGLVEGVAHRVGAGFAFVDLALAAEVADVGVIVGELGDAAGLG